MARPKKVGLEYFPLDCQMDDKILMLEAEHGMEGFGVYIRLLQTCYQFEDGKLDMSIVFRWKTLGKTLGILPENLRKMVDTMLEVDLFDRKTFNEEQKLTSNGIQKRLNQVSSLRQKERLRKAEGNSEQGEKLSGGKQGNSGRKSTQKEKERDTNVSPKGKGNTSSSDNAEGLNSSDDHTITHKLRLVMESLNPEYFWDGREGAAAKKLAEKLAHSYRNTRHEEPTDEQLVESFKKLISESRKLPDRFYHFNDMPKFNENYNKLVELIRNPAPLNGHPVTPSAPNPPKSVTARPTPLTDIR